MSEFNEGAAQPANAPTFKTIAHAEARHVREVEEGICVPIYVDEEKEENFLGFVRCALDHDGYQKKLARLKAKKGKSHVWSALELIPLERDAEIGTFFRGINDPDQPEKAWRAPDGSRMQDTEDNLRRVVAVGFVRRACWERISQEENFAAEQKADLQGN